MQSKSYFFLLHFREEEIRLHYIGIYFFEPHDADKPGRVQIILLV